MSTCIKPPSCTCGICRKCRIRERRQYVRARNRGFEPRPEPCRCGVCFSCTERARVAAWREKERAARAAGEPLPAERQRQAEERKRRRQEAIRAEWAQMAEVERNKPLTPRQRVQVLELIREMLL